MILLDTDFLIDFLGGKKEAVAKMDSIRNEPLAISSITFLELAYGEMKKQRSFDSESFSQTFQIIPFGSREARIAARIRTELEAEGGRIGGEDEMIAATAITHHTALVTRNIKHFKRVKGLKLESW